ncbi:pyridoxal phosphate-dependent aminotransferase [uncultured Hymenobacter sp.]|uniref:pyridoxal phosphate-dependent aminotransferase n=1 Tax=uncultured Hymenobacter sp. TaxID=170016 RepID=UPI0035CA7C3C
MLISLASGYGDFAVPAVALEAAVQSLQGLAGPLPVSEAAGAPELRAALAARYRQRGAAQVRAEHVIITPGTKAALFAVFSEVLRPGGANEVLLPTPNWFGFGELVRRAGGQLRELPLRPADDYTLAPATLRQALRPETRLLLLTNPNNPTGRRYTAAEWAALLGVTGDFPGLLVLSDEIYEGIVFDDDPAAPYAPAPTLLAQPDPHGQHVVVSGFSKSLALAGWGLGLVVAPPALAARLAERQFALAGAVPAPSQAAALAATGHAEAIGAALCRQLQPNRELLLAGLRALPGQPDFAAPAGTYYIFADFSRLLAPSLPPLAASKALTAELAAAGVLAVDGGTCGAPGFLRLSYAVAETDLREALRRLGQFVAARHRTIKLD